MFGFGKKRNQARYEKQMAEWLAHPMEFGVQPRSVSFKKLYQADLLLHGRTEIPLIDYVMPDGTTGRGFAAPVTWSFLGSGVQAIPDDDLVVAYAGWLWLLPALQAGKVETEFVSPGDEVRFIEERLSQGLTKFAIQDRYKIGDSEVFTFRALSQGVLVCGAGDREAGVMYREDEPRYHLPPEYFLFGQQMIKSLRLST